MSTVRPDYTTVLALCVLLDHVAVLTEECAGLDDLDSLVQAFSRCLCNAYSIGVCQRLVSNIVCLVQVAVKAVVVQCDVDVEDITVSEYSLIRNTVANDFVYRRTYGFGEMAIVEG